MRGARQSAGLLPDRYRGLNFLQIPTANIECGSAVFGLDTNQDAGFLRRYKTEAMLDKNTMGAKFRFPSREKLCQHFFGHRKVGGVLDASDGRAIFDSANCSQKLYFRAFFSSKSGLARADGVVRQEKRRQHFGLSAAPEPPQPKTWNRLRCLWLRLKVGSRPCWNSQLKGGRTSGNYRAPRQMVWSAPKEPKKRDRFCQ